MADLSFLPDQEDAFSFLPDQKPKPQIQLSGPAPVSQISPPTADFSFLPDLTPQVATEVGQSPLTIGPDISKDPLILYKPTEEDMTQVLSMVKPEERELARKVLQRDVTSREDLNLLQGKLKKFGEED